jgi:hypothetical protein
LKIGEEKVVEAFVLAAFTGLGGILVLLILSVIFKRDFLSFLSPGGGGTATSISQPDPARDEHEKP